MMGFVECSGDIIAVTPLTIEGIDIHSKKPQTINVPAGENIGVDFEIPVGYDDWDDAERDKEWIRPVTDEQIAEAFYQPLANYQWEEESLTGKYLHTDLEKAQITNGEFLLEEGYWDGKYVQEGVVREYMVEINIDSINRCLSKRLANYIINWNQKMPKLEE